MATETTFNYVFTALRGRQAGREFYVAMCPLKLIPKIFLFDEDELDPEVRAQRVLNRARIPELKEYLVANPKDYVLSSITASIDGDIAFRPIDGGHPFVGHLHVPMNSSFLINDGQHRRAAIEEAVKERPELRDETISVVFFIDTGLRRSQQMFADLNTHSVRPSKSLGILYDHRDNLSQLACRLVKKVPCFEPLTEMEKSSISNRSRKLFTLSSIYSATAKLLGKPVTASVSPDDERTAVEFWGEVCESMPDWQDALNNNVSSAELRRDYVHAHGVALQAIALVGQSLLSSHTHSWKEKLRGLGKIDWSRGNLRKWEGRALVGGKVSKAHSSVVLTSNLIKVELGIPLTFEEAELEKAYARR